jgi:hypothetical protein
MSEAKKQRPQTTGDPAAWRVEEREALLRHALTIAAQAARASGQGREGADAAAEFIRFIFDQAFAARDAELAKAGPQPGSGG